MVKRSVKIYMVMAFFLSSLIFFAGVGAGLLVEEMKNNQLISELASVKTSLQDAEIELKLMNYMKENISCDYLLLKSEELSRQADEEGGKLELYESSQPLNSRNYLLLKKDYMRLLVNNWLTMKRIKDSCGANYTTILYFYSNRNCAECDKQGYVLDYFKHKLGNRVMIFSLDSSLNLSFIDMLRYNYGIKSYPSLVINGRVFNRFVNSTELAGLLGI